MFEELLLQGTNERSIILETRTGRRIPNLVDVDPDYYHVQQYRRLLRKHPGWNERKPPTGGYNCVGHVWASRRTGVFDDIEDQVKFILDDDGYRRIEPNEMKKGDLVLYWQHNAQPAMFFHIGMVFEIKPGVGPESPGVPWVLSKLDSTSGEILHNCYDVEFIPGTEHSIEFWTDRPRQ